MRDRPGLDLFLISFLVLFLELACIRWFPSHVLFLTFFVNLVLLACFVGMSIGCLVARRPTHFIRQTPFWLVLGVGLGLYIGSHTELFRAVFAVAKAVAENLDHDIVFVNKSTVPVGTGKKCEELMREILRQKGVSHDAHVVSNPEFLREGMAVPDTMMPDRIMSVNSPFCAS